MEKKYFISSTKYSMYERQTKRGKVYDLRFRIMDKNGVEQHKRLSGYSTKTLAKQAYTDFITENCQLVKHNPIKRQKRLEQGKETATIKDLANSYFLSLRNQLKDSSIYDLQNIYKLYIAPTFADFQLKQLTKQELFAWQDKLWSTPNPKTNDFYSYKYLAKIRTSFSAFLTWCAERNEGFINYLLQIKKPKKRTQTAEMQFWKKEEFEKFIAVVDDNTYKTFFAMLFYTGRRKGEVLSLSPNDIKENGIVFNKSLTRKTLDKSPYKITTTKAEKGSITPICKPLKQFLKEYSAPKGQFYFGGEKPLAENTLTRAFNRYCELAGVKRIRLHDLRHSFVSMLISLGANLPCIASLIDDRLEQVVKTYAHLYEEDKIKIIDKIK